MEVSILTDVLQDPEVQKLAKWLAIDAVKRMWKQIFGAKPTRQEQSQIRQIVLATIADVHRYDPKLEAIELAMKRSCQFTARHKRAAVRMNARRGTSTVLEKSRTKRRSFERERSRSRGSRSKRTVRVLRDRD